MFEQGEVSADLDAQLREAGIDPSDPTVVTIKTVVSAYYAGRTAEVLARVKAVLDRFDPNELH